jgi:DnaK suppressor protein
MIEETKSAWESGDWAMDIKKIKAELLARRKALVELAEEAEGARQPVELDQTRVGRLSRMDALQGQAMAQETARRRDVEVSRIDAALKRVDEDEYGYCLACGEKIAAARLKLDPMAAVCVTCASGA